MKKLIIILAAAGALTGCAVSPHGHVQVDPVGAAVVGGLAGVAIGAAIARPRYEAPPAVYYPAPVYRHAPRPYYGPYYQHRHDPWGRRY